MTWCSEKSTGTTLPLPLPLKTSNHVSRTSMERQLCNRYISLTMYLNPEDGGSTASETFSFPTTKLHGATIQKTATSINDLVDCFRRTRRLSTFVTVMQMFWSWWNGASIQDEIPVSYFMVTLQCAQTTCVLLTLVVYATCYQWM